MRTVADAMTPAVTVDRATTIQATSAAMLDAGTQAAVVVDGRKVWGIVTAEGVLRALASGYEAAETDVAVIAERDAPAVRPNEPLAEVHQRMRAAGRAVAPVTGSHGEPLGLLTDPEAAA